MPLVSVLRSACFVLHLSACLHLTHLDQPLLLLLFLLADPQGYGMSGHLIRPSLDAEYIVPLTPYIIYPTADIIYSSLCPVSTAHPISDK